MNSREAKRGEVVIGLLVGLAIGSAMLWVNSRNYAQETANLSGRPVSQFEYLSQYPLESTITIVAPAGAGLGIGWLVETLSSSSGGNSSRDNVVSVGGEDNNVSVTISGDSDDDTNQEDNDGTDNDGSNNDSSVSP